MQDLLVPTAPGDLIEQILELILGFGHDGLASRDGVDGAFTLGNSQPTGNRLHCAPPACSQSLITRVLKKCWIKKPC